MPRLCNPVLLTHDLTQSFRAHTFSLREDPWPNFSFRVAYAHRIFDDATQCKYCFRIASASACLELSSATASATFRYAGLSFRKRNSRTSPLCDFIMEVFDAAQMESSAFPKGLHILLSPSRAKRKVAVSQNISKQKTKHKPRPRPGFLWGQKAYLQFPSNHLQDWFLENS